MGFGGGTMMQRGMSIREMARQLGCSRNKVRRYMHPGGHPNCPTYGHPNCSTWPG